MVPLFPPTHNASSPYPMTISSRSTHAFLRIVLGLFALCQFETAAFGQQFRAGAFARNIDPLTFPVWVNGGIAGQQSDRVRDTLFARCLVLEANGHKVAIAIVDNCILPHEVTDAAKTIVQQRLGLPPERVLIAATHTHSAVAVTGVHGCPVQEDYAAQLPSWIADGIVKADERLKPAQFGTTSVVAEKFIYCRDWLMKPGTANSTPFSGRTSDDVSMNPGYDNPNKLAPVGPIDRLIPILSIQDLEGKAIAVLATFSTHYAGAAALSSDYFGVVAQRLAKELRPDSPDSFVGIMANATSGNANCIDFSKPREPFTYAEVGNYVSDRILSVLPTVQYSRETTLDSAFDGFDVAVRMPKPKEVEEAKAWLRANLGDRLPKTMNENYARETVLMSELPATRRMNLQVFRLGDLAIVANPCESYCETGMKIRQSSPFAMTMNVGLANGHCGYIPPPEMFQLGGYTTWRCRSSCLDEQAEPKMVEGLTKLVTTLHARYNKTAANPKPNPPVPPIKPENTLSLFEVEDGFSVELVASEPQIVDPVSMQMDEKGRMWVVEMRDYPSGIDKPLSRIVVLEDLDADGFMETSHAFADGLLFATGLQPWKDGVLVTVEGKLVFLRDTDGDLKADTTETWLTGFSTTNSQLRANHPTLTSDGWLTIASGLRGGKVAGDPTSTFSQSAVDLAGSDVRVHLIGKQLESIAGPSQFGLTFDHVGRRYGCSNRQPCFEIVADRDDVNLSPLAGLGPSLQSTLPAEGNSRVYPLVNAWTTSTLHAGQFTAACGVCVTHSPIFGSRESTTVLTCEPTGGLVQRKSMTRPQGIGKDSATSDQKNNHEREWLASRDPWFRPVDLYEGPDGAIYVVDMYRAVIEHPEWVPKELKERPDQRLGDSHGRIYRVVRKGSTNKASPRLRDVFHAVEELATEDAWLQRQASRLILQSIDEHGLTDSIETKVRATLHNACQQSNIATANVCAGILSASNKVAVEDINGLLDSDRSEIRIVGLRFAKNMVGSIGPTNIDGFREKCLAILTGENAEESRQAAWCLARLPKDFSFSTSQISATAKRMAHQADDRYLWMAISAMLRHQLDAFLPAYLAQVQTTLSTDLQSIPVDVESDALERLSTWFAKQQGSDVPTMVKTPIEIVLNTSNASSPRRFSIALGVLSGVAKAGNTKPLEDASLVLRLQEIASAPGSSRLRSQAIKLLGGTGERSVAFLLQRLDDADNEIVREALIALGKRPSPELTEWLVRKFATAPASLRPAMFQSVRSHPERMSRFLEAMESNLISIRLLDAGQLQSLKSIESAELRTRVEKLLSSLINEDRAKLVASYSEKLKGQEVGNDPTIGKTLFQKNCASCHQMDGMGFAVGPNISDSREHTYEKLLVAILDPNRAIDANYFRTLALTDDGETVEGLLRDSNAQSITLELQNGVKRVLNRSELVEFKSSGKSMMPEGMEAQLSVEEMGELLWYVKNWRYVADNVPAVAKLP
ncbi:MAG: c-type cytochrome [Planctomycetota bacterium]|nr:c-type cytochrome [Planctomycetota bacterium]